jgi:hypothetical protein
MLEATPVAAEPSTRACLLHQLDLRTPPTLRGRNIKKEIPEKDQLESQISLVSFPPIRRSILYIRVALARAEVHSPSP